MNVRTFVSIGVLVGRGSTGVGDSEPACVDEVHYANPEKIRIASTSNTNPHLINDRVI